MIKIEYPPYEPAIKKVKGKEFIFDEIRRQWIMLTNEEWVRENFLRYLVQVKKYPSSLVAVEKEIRLDDLIRRFDILVYSKAMRPWLMVECKEMNEVLDAKVLSQALRYNISLKVQYIIITNGKFCYGFSAANGAFAEIDRLPDFDD